MDNKPKNAAQGVEAAWDFWLSPEIIESAIQKAFSRWLNEHKAEIIAAIAAKAQGGRS